VGGAGRERDKLLLDAEQERVHVARRGVGLVLADFAEGEVVTPAEVDERELEAAVSVLQRGHGCSPPFWKATSPQRQAVLFASFSPEHYTAQEKGLRAVALSPYVPCDAEDEVRRMPPVVATAPSTWRVCQFRHSGAGPNDTIGKRPPGKQGSFHFTAPIRRAGRPGE